MFDLGSWGEILIIAVLGLVILGPKEIPHALKTIGKWVYKIRRLSNQIQQNLNELGYQAEREDVMQASAKQEKDDELKTRT